MEVTVPHVTRRYFLHTSLATAAGAVLPAAAESGAPKAGPNDLLRVGVIGVRGQGRTHVSRWSSLKDVEVAAVCDPDENVIHDAMTAAEKKSGKKPRYYKDLRKLFEDKSIDAVSIATPNHWHVLASIWAIQAGKDVYVEKPVSHNVWEGSKDVEAARKHGKNVQTGKKRRASPSMTECMSWTIEGRLHEKNV